MYMWGVQPPGKRHQLFHVQYLSYGLTTAKFFLKKIAKSQ